MNRAVFIQFMLLLMLMPMAAANAECPETPNGTRIYLGVDTTMPVTIVSPEINELDLLRVQIVWVPTTPAFRHKQF